MPKKILVLIILVTMTVYSVSYASEVYSVNGDWAVVKNGPRTCALESFGVTEKGDNAFIAYNSLNGFFIGLTRKNWRFNSEVRGVVNIKFDGKSLGEFSAKGTTISKSSLMIELGESYKSFLSNFIDRNQLIFELPLESLEFRLDGSSASWEDFKRCIKSG